VSVNVSFVFTLQALAAEMNVDVTKRKATIKPAINVLFIFSPPAILHESRMFI
jgi:hypothetical protein